MVAGKISFKASFLLASLPLFLTSVISAAAVDASELDSISDEFSIKGSELGVLNEFSAETDELSLDFENHAEASSQVVRTGDTLWSLAAKLCPPELTVWQSMDAFFTANPSAFLNGDPSKIVIGSDFVNPTIDLIASQSGVLVADELGIEVYENEVNEIALENEPIEEAKFQEPESQEIAEQEIPYTIVNDVTTERSGALEVSDESKLQTKEGSAGFSPLEVDTSELLATIDTLTNELKALEDKLKIEQQKKNQIIAQAQRLSTGVKTSPWIEQTESKISIFVAIVSIIFGVSLFNRTLSKKNVTPPLGRENEPDIAEEVDYVNATPDEDIFSDNETSSGDVFAEKSEDPTDAPGFEFTDDFNPESGEDLDYLEPSESIDPVDVKLDLAQTYADLGDISGAREILEEIISESNKDGIARAQAVLEKLNLDLSE
jgi:FimV-like protein